MKLEIPAIVERVRFRNTSGFGILSVTLNANSSKYNPEMEQILTSNIQSSKYDTFTITVDMLKPEENIEGQECIFIGDFCTHPKYGAQFKSEFYYLDEPVNEAGLQAYLMTLTNIKKVRSEKILKKFGFEGTLRILDEDIYKLTAINGITEQRVPAIKEAWEKNKALRALYIWLSEHSIEPKIGKQAYDLWGINSQSILSENPYRLTELKGMSFNNADKLAHKILDVVPLDYRVTACVKYLLVNNLYKDSNLCLPYKILQSKVLILLNSCDNQHGVSGCNYKDAVIGAIKGNRDLFVAVRIHGRTTYIYLKHIWEKERYIADFIYGRYRNYKKVVNCNDRDIDAAEKDLRSLTGINITLDDTQRNAVKAAFNHKISIITGGGGTGKSTICRCICYLAKEKRLSIRLMSPTGKAAQVLSDKTKRNAKTIHRSLKMIPGDDYAKESIKENVIIIDEFSMVGIETLFAVLYAMADNPRASLILVGDSNQLPSVSPGNFLFDIVESKCVEVIQLDRIHRQDDNSYISIIANKIAHGEQVTVPKGASDLKWFNIDEDTFSDSIQKFVSYFIQKKDIADLQILAPMYKGQCGVNKINEVIQEMMAKINGTTEMSLTRDFKYFHIGDRIIQTKNNYDKQIFNGDMGVIVDLGRKILNAKVSDAKEDYIVVKFYNDEIMFLGDEISQLQLAWCITVHKYQGSQSPYIAFIMASEAEIMMTKELVYTAFTRAEKYLIIYGDYQMLQVVPNNSVIRERYTNLSHMLIEMKDGITILEILGA